MHSTRNKRLSYLYVILLEPLTLCITMTVIEKGEHKEPKLIESGNMAAAPFKIKKKNIFRKIKDYFQG